VDIVDETINYFKANVFFNTYEIKGDSDRLLLYLTLYCHQCLTRMTRASSKDAVLKEMYQLSIETFKLPMDAGFPISSFYSQCASKREQDELRQYLLHLRQELGLRLAERVCEGGGAPSKWWLCFTKRRFLGKSLEAAGAHNAK
jgi:actin related protein 2/3 complex subunit 3